VDHLPRRLREVHPFTLRFEGRCYGVDRGSSTATAPPSSALAAISARTRAERLIPSSGCPGTSTAARGRSRLHRRGDFGSGPHRDELMDLAKEIGRNGHEQNQMRRGFRQKPATPPLHPAPCEKCGLYTRHIAGSRHYRRCYGCLRPMFRRRAVKGWRTRRRNQRGRLRLNDRPAMEGR
jgi:hypothetical protein